jgi:hypothetical protein
MTLAIQMTDGLRKEQVDSAGKALYCTMGARDQALDYERYMAEDSGNRHHIITAVVRTTTLLKKAFI